MSDYGPDCGGRIKGVSIVKPIVYGNVARYFGKKREEDGHTHSWNVYVKPFHNEDMSTYVKKVHFKLHESYANPNRIVTKPPFEITETGWGEFEVSIKLYFMDPNERPITIYHILKLFETDPTSKQIHIKKYIISEFYDEIIFQDPSAMMQQLLTNTRQLTIGPYKHETDFEEKKHKTIASIQSAKVKVKTEIEELKDRLKQTQTTIAKFKENIASTEAKQEKEQKQLQAQLQQQAVVASVQSVSSQESQQTPVKAQAQIQPMQQVVETGVTSGSQLETQTEQVKPPSESLQSIQEIQPEPMELQQHPQPIEKEISGIQVMDQKSETTTLQSDRVQTETK